MSGSDVITVWERCERCGRFTKYYQYWDTDLNIVTKTCSSCGYSYRYRSRSGCFITTATLKSLKVYDDNCYELTTFRKFRDTWLNSFHPEDIEEYYFVAPSIVKGIDSLKDSDKTYLTIWEKYLQPCLTHIENDDNEQAYLLYKQMVEDLRNCFILKKTSF